MDYTRQLTMESPTQVLGEAIGMASALSMMVAKVIAFLSLAEVNTGFTIAVSIVTFFYVGLKAYNQWLIALEKRKQLKDPPKPEE